MSLYYRVLYTLGITPWERTEVPSQVREVAGARPQPGRALDLGCGTGRDAVHLAHEGWAVTGVDGVPKALDGARRRSADAGVDVEWLEGDVTRLEGLGLAPGYDLVLDRGCFHGLSDDERERCAAGIDALAAEDAELLVFAFSPGRLRPGPRGMDVEQLQGLLGPRWELVSSDPDLEARLPPWLRGANPMWHRLRRARGTSA